MLNPLIIPKSCKEAFLCKGISRLKAGIFWNCFLWPFVFLWHATIAYCLPCFSVYLYRLIHFIYGKLSGRLHTYFTCCATSYTDVAFGGTDALGKWELHESVEWIRAGIVVANLYSSESNCLLNEKQSTSARHPQLFEGEIESADVCQGALGDCWLVAAFACSSFIYYESYVCVIQINTCTLSHSILL